VNPKKKTVKYRRRPAKKESFSRQVIKGILRVLIVILLFVIVYYTTRLTPLTIKNITISGGETVVHEELQREVQSVIQGTYLGLVPKHFTYLYPRNQIIRELEQIQKIHNVKIERVGREELLISFDEYIPHALWCADESTGKPCYYLTKDGYAFAEAPVLQGGALVRHYSEHSNESLPSQVINQSALVSIDRFIENIEEQLGFRISSVTHMSNNDAKLHVNGGGDILISLNKDLEKTLDDIAAVLSSTNFAHIEPGNFQYIDARFNKMFINETLETATSTDDINEDSLSE